MRKKKPDIRDRIYWILSAAILFPWVVWLIIELPPLSTIFAS